MDSGLFISGAVFRALPADVQKTLLAVLTDGSADVGHDKPDAADWPADDDEPAALSPKQVRRLIEGCGPRTKTALRLISEQPDGVSLAKLAARMEAEPSALKNVWSGLTKRVRTVTGSDTAVLIEWSEVGGGDDWTGRLAEETRASLEAVFGPASE